MKILKYFFMFALISIVFLLLIFIISGGNALFLLGGIPLVFGGFWTFGGKNKRSEE